MKNKKIVFGIFATLLIALGLGFGLGFGLKKSTTTKKVVDEATKTELAKVKTELATVKQYLAETEAEATAQATAADRAEQAQAEAETRAAEAELTAETAQEAAIETIAQATEIEKRFLNAAIETAKKEAAKLKIATDRIIELEAELKQLKESESETDDS